jgi:hypothetical protein
MNDSAEYGLLGLNPAMIAFREGVWGYYYSNVSVPNESEIKGIIKGFVAKFFTLAKTEE